MAQKLKFGNGVWANKEGSTLAYNDENGNYKPLPFNFTRSTSATRVNKQGLVEVVKNNKPRIDYKDSAKGALLLEPSRSNLINYSESFDNAYWTKSFTSVTANQTISPDGSQTADTITKTGDYGSITKSGITISSGSNYTLSIFVKKGTTDFFSLRQASGSYDVRKQFNLTTKEVSNGLGANQTGFVSSKIEEYPNDWYRLSIVCTSNGTSLNISFYSGKVGESTFNGDSYAWGAQVEDGSYPTSYIPTQGAAVTRVAETASGSGNSEVFNDSEGVFYAQISTENDGTYKGISISDGTFNNTIIIGKSNINNRIYGRINVGGVNQGDININDINTDNFYKVALKYSLNNVRIFVNGFLLGTDTTSNVFSSNTLNSLNFNGGANGVTNFYGKTKELGYYDILTDAELEYLTSYRSWESMVNELNLNIIYNG